MNAEQKNLNDNLPQVPVFQEVRERVAALKAGQDKIIKMIEDNETETKAEFDKGAKKFQELTDEVNSMKNQITDGFSNISDELREYKTEMKDERISKLTKQLEKRDEEDANAVKEKRQFWMGVTKTVVAGVVLAVALVMLNNMGLPTK